MDIFIMKLAAYTMLAEMTLHFMVSIDDIMHTKYNTIIIMIYYFKA